MITASAIAASREQTSPAPPRLLDMLQQAALPQKVLPTRIALSQRNCRFQLCFRGLNRG